MTKHRKKLKPRIHIFHNGAVAEQSYFEDFKVFLAKQDAWVNITNYHKRTQGKAPWQVIDEASKLDLRDEEDQIWCVFDVDDFLKNNPAKFEEGLKKAKDHNISVAWTNECFELWLLLHFEQVSTTIPRKDYEKKLKPHFKKIRINYAKNFRDAFETSLPLQKEAVKRAKRLQNKPEINPSTSIFLLIEELNKFLDER